MRYVEIAKLEPGMILGRDIYDIKGRTLVCEKTILTQQYIDGLIKYEFAGVYIEDDLSKGIESHEIIPIELRAEGQERLENGDIDGCKEIAEKIVNEVMMRGFGSFDLIDLRAHSDVIYSHSVSVAILCCIMAIAMDFEYEELQDMVMAALLHDIGKAMIPSAILNKPDRLTPDEYEVVKTHAQLSYETIKERFDLSYDVKQAVLHHHENVDGSGYPFGYSDSDLSIYAKILHVADVYDALISKRPYKKPYTPLEACEYLMGGCGIMFDYNVVKILTENVPIHMKGTKVTLSDGRVGAIYENSGMYNLRPIVRLEDGTLVDLTERDNLGLSILPPDAENYDNPDDMEEGRNKAKDKASVFIVDDMRTNIMMLETILREDYMPRSFESGEDFLEALAAGDKPDLVLMDIDMPNMTGIQAVEEMKKVISDVPVLFVSSLCDRETVLATKRLGVQGYVLRPYNNMYILGEVAKIIDGWGDRF